MQSKQAAAIFQALAFLGTVGALLASAAVIAGATLIGEERLGRWITFGSGWIFGGRGLARKVLVAALVLVAGYSAALFGASFASHEWMLPPGEEKYFCEIDCHLAYSVVNVEKTKTFGARGSVIPAQGEFYVVTVRTRFDEKTISPHRGNSPLEPSPRVVAIVDEQGRHYNISAEGQQALDAAQRSGTPLTTPLRPGESYTTKLVFDLPSGARNPRLLIESPTNPKWLGRVLIGDEDSLFHKKVFLRLATGWFPRRYGSRTRGAAWPRAIAKAFFSTRVAAVVSA